MFAVYVILRLLVIAALVRSAMLKEYEEVCSDIVCWC